VHPDVVDLYLGIVHRDRQVVEGKPDCLMIGKSSKSALGSADCRSRSSSTR